MPVLTPTPRRRSSRLAAFASLILLVLSSASLFAKGPQPAVSIPLDPLGFQPIAPRSLLGGGSMLTVDYVDATHLLVTFNARRLIRRIPNDPPTDEDRNVDALLLELPSGRVLARAEWVFHDHGQYLWNVGHGQFLIRIRNNFSIIAPLANLAHGDAFVLHPFLYSARRIEAVTLSADATFLTIESTPPPPLVSDDDTVFSPLGPQRRSRPAPPSDVQLNFYRLNPGGENGYIVPEVAGGARSAHLIELPLTPGGLLQVLDQGHQRWAFDFRAHGGKLTQLALFDSTCRPLPLFISPSEFIAFGCHGGTIRQQLAAFNLRGEATWEAALPGAFIAPYFVFAPSAGRFVLSRVLTNSIAFPLDSTDPAFFSGQTVDVYQDDSGKVLLHLDCTPISRAGQNVTLSPDGMNLALIRDGVVEIYPLPPLSPRDKTAIKLAQDTAPPPTTAMIDLAAAFGAPAADTSADSAVGPSPAPPADASAQQAPAGALPASQPPAPTSASLPPAPTSDSPLPDAPVIHRKPPSLYDPPAPSPDAPPQSDARQ